MITLREPGASSEAFRGGYDEGMRRLLLIRHGRTDWNISGRLNSFTDIPLDAVGRQQAMQMGEHVRQLYPTFYLMASPALRARQTAEALRGAAQIAKDAAEVHFGRFEGRTGAEIRAAADGPDFERWENGLPMEGAESLTAASLRAGRVFEQILAGKADTTILVSHGLFIRVLIYACVLKVDATTCRSMVIDNASVSTVVITDRDVRLTGLNDTHFLRSSQ